MTDTAGPTSTAMSTDADLPGQPPAPRTWETRADLLRDRADCLTRLHAADLALRPMLRTSLLLGLAAVSLTLASGSVLALRDDERTTPAGASVAVGLVCAALTGLLVWRAWSRTMQARETGLRRRAWEDLAEDPAARALPRGNIDPPLREPFDARKDPDATEYIETMLVRKYISPGENRLLARAALSGLFIAPGLLFVLAPAVSGSDGTMLLPGGAVLLVSGGVQVAKATQRAYRATQRWKRARNEYQQWNAQRPHGPAT